MKLNYHAEADSLYIEFSERPSVDSRKISEGGVADEGAASSDLPCLLNDHRVQREHQRERRLRG
jgi:hypothetical protein